MRKVGINYKCLCQGMLFPLPQGIVEVSGHEPEISHPKFKTDKRPKSRISSAGTNNIFIPFSVKWDFRRAWRWPEFRKEERRFQGMGQSRKGQRDNS